MPLQNRVTPLSTLVTVDARGTLMGNRGCLHDGNKHIVRSYLGKRWIICLLEFKGRRRPIMQPGKYTELFFLDEATAFAAGHRPCAECQRDRFEAFREAWVSAGLDAGGSTRPSAATIDEVLHRERLEGGQQRTYSAALDSLPDGTFVGDEDEAYLMLEGKLLRWSPWGYTAVRHQPLPEPARLLTPRPLVAVLAAGYPIGIHPTAFEALARVGQCS